MLSQQSTPNTHLTFHILHSHGVFLTHTHTHKICAKMTDGHRVFLFSLCLFTLHQIVFIYLWFVRQNFSDTISLVICNFVVGVSLVLMYNHNYNYNSFNHPHDHSINPFITSDSFRWGGFYKFVLQCVFASEPYSISSIFKHFRLHNAFEVYPFFSIRFEIRHGRVECNEIIFHSGL